MTRSSGSRTQIERFTSSFSFISAPTTGNFTSSTGNYYTVTYLAPAKAQRPQNFKSLTFVYRTMELYQWIRRLLRLTSPPSYFSILCPSVSRMTRLPSGPMSFYPSVVIISRSANEYVGINKTLGQLLFSLPYGKDAISDWLVFRGVPRIDWYQMAKPAVFSFPFPFSFLWLFVAQFGFHFSVFQFFIFLFP